MMGAKSWVTSKVHQVHQSIDCVLLWTGLSWDLQHTGPLLKTALTKTADWVSLSKRMKYTSVRQYSVQETKCMHLIKKLPVFLIPTA